MPCGCVESVVYMFCWAENCLIAERQQP